MWGNDDGKGESGRACLIWQKSGGDVRFLEIAGVLLKPRVCQNGVVSEVYYTVGVNISGTIGLAEEPVSRNYLNVQEVNDAIAVQVGGILRWLR